MEIGELCNRFEEEAKALGYEVEVLALYNAQYDRHQINWNDNVSNKIIDNVCENVSIALWKIAREDKDRVINALTTGHFYTREGAKAITQMFTNALKETIEEANETLADATKSCFDAGVSLGKAILEIGEGEETTILEEDEPTEDETIETIYETVECPRCGHPATHQHERGINMGVIYCPNCEKEAE